MQLKLVLIKNGLSKLNFDWIIAIYDLRAFHRVQTTIFLVKVQKFSFLEKDIEIDIMRFSTLIKHIVVYTLQKALKSQIPIFQSKFNFDKAFLIKTNFNCIPPPPLFID